MSIDQQCVALPAGFPVQTFTIDVSPSAIRFSVEAYRRFSTVVRDVVEGFEGATVDWAGAEGRLYSERRAAYVQLPAAAQASFVQFHRRVSDFADTAERLHARMAVVRERAVPLWMSLRTPPAPRPTTADLWSLTPVPTGKQLEAEFDQLCAEAARIRSEFEQAVRETAGAIRALPGPPDAPATAAAHAAMPPLVTKRDVYGAEATVTAVNALARQGIHVETEDLDNGRVLVRVMGETGAGVGAGVGGGAEVEGRGMPTSPVDAKADAEAVLSTRTGFVVEMDASAVPGYLTRLGLGHDHPAAVATPRDAKTGVLLEVAAGAAAEAEGTIPGLVDVGAEAKARASMRGELYDDGSSVLTLTGTAGSKAELAPGQIDTRGVPRLKDLEVERPEGAGMESLALGGVAAMAYTLRTNRDGSATITRTKRVEAEGEDEVKEQRTTRVVSAAEAREVREHLEAGRAQKAIAAVQEIARDLEAGSGAATESHELTYAVDEDEMSAEVGISEGAKLSADGGVTHRSETLIEVDGVKR